MKARSGRRPRTPASAPAASPTGASSESGTKSTPKTVDSGTLHDRIAKRAYEIYDQRGREDGHALDDWLQAEREILRGGSS